MITAAASGAAVFHIVTFTFIMSRGYFTAVPESMRPSPTFQALSEFSYFEPSLELVEVRI